MARQIGGLILILAVILSPAYAAKNKKPKKIYKKDKEVIQQVNPVDANSQLKLGMMYIDGNEVRRNYRKAVKWLSKSAQAGNPIAMDMLGKLYMEKHTPGWNDKKMFKFLSKSAAAGDSRTYCNLGYMYRGGFGIKNSDYKKAAEWFIKSANAGYSCGMYYLGWMYDKGFGVAQDFNEAFVWYSKAAHAGFAEAQYELAMMYSHAHIVRQDYVEAYKWFLLAEANGRDVFEDKYFIEKKMTKVQIDEAKSQIK